MILFQWSEAELRGSIIKEEGQIIYNRAQERFSYRRLQEDPSVLAEGGGSDASDG